MFANICYYKYLLLFVTLGTSLCLCVHLELLGQGVWTFAEFLVKFLWPAAFPKCVPVCSIQDICLPLPSNQIPFLVAAQTWVLRPLGLGVALEIFSKGVCFPTLRINLLPNPVGKTPALREPLAEVSGKGLQGTGAGRRRSVFQQAALIQEREARPSLQYRPA